MGFSLEVAVDFSPLTSLFTMLSCVFHPVRLCCNGLAVSPPLSVSTSSCVPLSRVSAAVESLYAALKSIDRMDIVNMLEGQPPQPVRQGSRDMTRRRNNEREHLSPGMTNGKFPLPRPTVQPLPHVPFLPWPRATSPINVSPLNPPKGKAKFVPHQILSVVPVSSSFTPCDAVVYESCHKLLQDFTQQHAEGLRTLLLHYNPCSASVYSLNLMESREKYTTAKKNMI